MCAIAGMIGLPSQETTKEKMLSTMARRGPDEQGSYTQGDCTLLHTRLSVIDPEGGKQPMHLSYGEHSYVMVYNGELYNTRQLRRELEGLGHRFVGHSDTEVLLHAYAQWQEACLEKFNGIFAFAIWEEKGNKLFLARDRMGVKPLFYAFHQGGFLFASEIKTILAYPGFAPRVDTQGAAELLLLGPGRTPGCGVFQGICEIPAGCCATLEKGRWRQHQYWQLCDREHTQDFQETAEQVKSLVLDAIEGQMVSDFPIGTFLSGGLDSSLITAVCTLKMKDKGESLKTFSVDYQHNERYFTPSKFQPNSDGYYIDLMHHSFATQQHDCVLTAQELFDSLEEAVIARDLPGMADVDISLLCFCKRIRKEVKVALSGECADEIFGGYPWFRDPEIRELDGFPWAQSTKQRCAMLSPGIKEKLDAEGYIRQRYIDTCNSADILPGTSPLERRMKQMMVLNMHWFMQTLLDRKDRMSMYSGLEVRVPFCDYRIAEYLYGVPWEYKDYQGKEKGLLRYAMKDYLPEQVLWRKKSPYPKTFDPAYLQLVSQSLTQLLEDKDAPVFQLVDKKQAQLLLQTEYTWPWYGQLMKLPQTICYLLQINAWMLRYGIDINF